MYNLQHQNEVPAVWMAEWLIPLPPTSTVPGFNPQGKVGQACSTGTLLFADTELKFSCLAGSVLNALASHQCGPEVRSSGWVLWAFWFMQTSDWISSCLPGSEVHALTSQQCCPWFNPQDYESQVAQVGSTGRTSWCLPTIKTQKHVPFIIFLNKYCEQPKRHGFCCLLNKLWSNCNNQ